jgi:hypothetical protein
LQDASDALPDDLPRHTVLDEAVSQSTLVAFWPEAFRPVESILAQLYDDLRLARAAALVGSPGDDGPPVRPFPP